MKREKHDCNERQNLDSIPEQMRELTISQLEQVQGGVGMLNPAVQKAGTGRLIDAATKYYGCFVGVTC